jgi:hypothetical protein
MMVQIRAFAPSDPTTTKIRLMVPAGMVLEASHDRKGLRAMASYLSMICHAADRAN